MNTTERLVSAMKLVGAIRKNASNQDILEELHHTMKPTDVSTMSNPEMQKMFEDMFSKLAAFRSCSIVLGFRSLFLHGKGFRIEHITMARLAFIMFPQLTAVKIDVNNEFKIPDQTKAYFNITPGYENLKLSVEKSSSTEKFLLIRNVK
jgi:hypothetical protein